jgi:hypothetical protein
MPPLAVVALVVGCALSAAAGAVDAAQPQLYPTGPKNGAAYVRFVNTASNDISVTSNLARIDLPATASRRATEYRAVVPGSALSAALQAGGRTRTIALVPARNEMVTVAVGDTPSTGPTPVVFREIPDDFNALKVSVALYNADDHCPDGQLLAGERKIPVISDIRPGAYGRRTINPINMEIFGDCGKQTHQFSVHLIKLEAGERYSVIFFAEASGVLQALVIHDQIESNRP